MNVADYHHPRAKIDRNNEIYRRAKDGEKRSVLVQEFKISRGRIAAIIAKMKRDEIARIVREGF